MVPLLLQITPECNILGVISIYCFLHFSSLDILFLDSRSSQGEPQSSHTILSQRVCQITEVANQRAIPEATKDKCSTIVQHYLWVQPFRLSDPRFTAYTRSEMVVQSRVWSIHQFRNSGPSPEFTRAKIIWVLTEK